MAWSNRPHRPLGCRGELRPNAVSLRFGRVQPGNRAMSHAPFVHLRVRSCYSLLESTVRPPDLLACCRTEQMPAVGVTDRANLFGALDFSQKAAGAGVQPLIGCLLPIENDETTANGRPPVPFWVPVLVQNEQGYQNLLKLLSRAHLDSASGAGPEISVDHLRDLAEGLILLTGGPDGPIGQALLHGKRSVAEAWLGRLKEAFPGRLYVELMRHGVDAEDEIEPALIELAERL
ncbi:MAG: PHP domain-containing protein, partial [Nitrospirota bacterium]|nr:PHP domain-containing protein [Nitrospirota bacterium]